MPFTLVHPAAVVLIARSPLAPSALVAGAMAPDLPYYVSLLWIGGDYNLTLTHSASSLLWLDPLIALVLLAAFHTVLKKPLVALMPPAAAGRVAPYVDGFGWRTPAAVGWIVVSAAVGAATHLGWDALCDAFGYAWSTRLNLSSNVVGTLVLLMWLWHWWRSSGPQPVHLLPAQRRVYAAGAVVLLTAAWTVVRGLGNAATVSADLREYGGWSRSAVLEHVARQAVVDVATALVVVISVYALAWHVHRLAGSHP